MVDEFAPPKFFASVRGIEHDQLFTEFNVGAARQISLSAEVRMCVEYNVKEKRRLKSVVDRQAELLKVREGEIENLKAQLLLREEKAAEVICLRAEASNFGAVERSLWDETDALKERNAIFKKELDALDVNVTELEASTVSKERGLTDLNALVTIVKSRNDNLVNKGRRVGTRGAQITLGSTLWKSHNAIGYSTFRTIPDFGVFTSLTSPSAPNAPSKTPSTKDTFSSSIDYIPKSPTSSTSLSPNGYLNSLTSPPPRVSPPPPTQENASMDITLTFHHHPIDVHLILHHLTTYSLVITFLEPSSGQWLFLLVLLYQI
ncbi:hypothetical protein Tco_0004534 [Tanacetum coccineum]